MSASIFNGTAVKLLKDILRFKTGIEVITGNTGDPTSVAVNAPIGSIYVRSGTDDVYVKGDAGSSTNWKKLTDTTEVLSSTGFLDLNMVSTADRDAETSVGSWVAYADAAASTPVDMTGGSPNTTIARTTTAGEILRGAASFKLTKSSGASRQGEGVSLSFTVPPSAQGKPVSVRFPFRVTSGSVVEGDFKVFVYDSTNSLLITPFANDIVGGSGTLVAQFISTPSAATPANQTYRVGIHIATTTNSAVSIVFDDVEVKPETVAYGSISTDWSSYVPTLTTTGGTVTKATTGITVDIAWWRRVGDSMEFMYTYSATNTTGGSESAGTILVPLPTGYTINTNKIDLVDAGTISGGGAGLYNRGTVLGYFMGKNSATVNNGDGLVMGYDTTRVMVLIRSNNGTWSTGNLSLRNGAGTVSVTMKATVPILNWEAASPLSASNQYRMSNILATGTRVTGTAPTKLGEYRSYLRNSSARTYTETNGSPTDAPSATNGLRLYGGSGFGSADANNTPTKYEIFIGKNKQYVVQGYDGTGFTGNLDLTPVGSFAGTNEGGYLTSYDPSTGILSLTKAVLVGQTSAGFAGMDESNAIVTNGYCEIFVSDKINTVTFDSVPMARYYNSATSLSGSLATVNWTTKDYDNYGAMSSGTYTVPTAGKYQVNIAAALSGTFILNNTTIMELQKNGTAVAAVTHYIAAAVTNEHIQLSDIISCNAGDTLRVQLSNSGTGPAFVNSNTKNFMSIVRVSNE